MIEKHNTATGPFHRAKPAVCQRVNGYCANYHRIYVGVTSTPERRWRDHQAQAGWRKMVLLYRSGSQRQAAHMEQALIAHIRTSKFLIEPDNRSDGGDNLPRSAGRLWVYLLVA